MSASRIFASRHARLFPFPGPGLVGLTLRLALGALVLPGAPALLAAQGFGGSGMGPEGPPRMLAGGGIVVGQPLGEFGDYVSVGFGLDAFGRIALDPEGWISLRMDAAFLTYGRETNRVCFSSTVGCVIQLDVTTSNNILSMGIGPEIAVPLGGRGGGVYMGVGAGFSYFSTDSEVRGAQSADPAFATTRNYSDAGFAWTAAGGVRVPLTRGETPVSLDLGVRRLGSGLREYLTEGDISEGPGGSLELNVRRSEADLLLWRFGVSVGLRPRR
ncbi:MAG: hypothetical protein EA350_00920 [Gemmatimonadales bacterium]|nr:MAG: hypothetical protein EA350_00920 [Gemmatimonadales bacterium]